MAPPLKPVQLAYFVSDILASALRAAETLGAGPFFVIEGIRLESAEHRGQSCDFVHSSAYGQCGDLMMEFVQQADDGPSPFRDLYESGEGGGCTMWRPLCRT